MVCQKCGHKNVVGAKFCSVCGEKLNEQVVQTGVPNWIWIVLIVSCITIGGVGSGFGIIILKKKVSRITRK